jgi:hypothetical protein
MTLSQATIMSREVTDTALFNQTQAAGYKPIALNPDLPKKYTVAVRKKDAPWKELYIGHVVSYLTLDEWLAWKGFTLDTVYNTEIALFGEKTDLF